MTAPLSGRVTQGSFFEGLFVRALGAEGGFADALRTVGVDVRRLQPSYPIEVWNEALEVAWKQRFPHLGREDAYRQMGRQLAFGFSRTLVGKVVDVSLPLLGPDRFVMRIPSLSKLDTFEYEVRVEKLGDKGYRVSYRNDPDAKPDFMAGLFEEGLRKTGVSPTVAVTLREPQGFDLEMRW
ncbi:DUF2378 family protein [Hyalangium rubrum]|uniref:DUF2378 family protein n=1 Tax=Hyalangium rubrum TaxID=3103134 RepID=A0ABU5H4T2_9BACT|nr:DUF2378 family protein [Hyalangium sp. s54d21]MDY7227787.1 DUF2378 family protein [Hyalangium sp. s54d21]